MDNAETGENLSVQSILAEFAALRSEMDHRSGHQHALMALTLTGLATVTGYVLATGANLILLAVPFFSTLLGLLWLDHAIVIGKIGAYIGEELRDELIAATGNDNVFLWELKAWEAEKLAFQRRVLFGIPVFGAFGGGSFVALIAARSALQSLGHTILWYVDGFLLVTYIVASGIFLLRPQALIPRKHRR